MAFHDVNFPLELAFGASGGPTHAVEIVTLASGHEARNSRQSRARRRYNAVTGVKSLNDAQILSAFFEARSGPLHSFRFRDPIDHTANDIPIGVGDGCRRNFHSSNIMTASRVRSPSQSPARFWSRWMDYRLRL